MSNAHYWSDADKSVVAERLKEGLSASMIAAQFKRTRNAIVGLVHRDATLREIGFAREGNGGRHRADRQVATVRRRSLNPSVVRRVLPRPSILDDLIEGVPMVALMPGQCKWAVNDAAVGETHMFCGAPSEGSYCAHHMHRSRFIRRAS